MGESPDRVYNTGALSLDNLESFEWLTTQELESRIGIELSEPPLIITFHPVTLEKESTVRQFEILLEVLGQQSVPLIFTYPNADTNSRELIELLETFVGSSEERVAVKNLGTQAYFSLLREGKAMVGNSSSGIIEAGSFSLPVINIGNRQKGRIAGNNVIHCLSLIHI